MITRAPELDQTVGYKSRMLKNSINNWHIRVQFNPPTYKYWDMVQVRYTVEEERTRNVERVRWAVTVKLKSKHFTVPEL